ncbi:hypothetical protein LTR85_007946 [Meristemomyces frigidus]|nr:hypothetical protein LTR85_007946 [Meristemomyces frigidus]
MTTRNFNGNRIDTLRRQYAHDLKDDCPHPVKYLLWNPQKQRELYYLIPERTEEQQLRRSLVQYHKATKGTSTVDWENEYVKVYLHPRYNKDAGESRQQAHQELPTASTDDKPTAQGDQVTSQ